MLAPAPPSAGAPVSPREPPTTSTWPRAELGRRCSRRGSTPDHRGARSGPTRRVQRRAARDADVDRLDARRRAALPGLIHRPGLAAWKLTVTVARTAAPATPPVEASTPLGTSTLTTGRARAVDRLDRLGHGAVGLAREARPEQGVRRARPLPARGSPRARRRRAVAPRLAAEAQRRRPGQALEVRARVAGELLRRRHAHAPSPRAPHRAAAARPRARRRRCCPCRTARSPGPSGRDALERPRHAGPRALHQIEPRHARAPRSPSGRSRASVSASGSGVSQSGRASTDAMLDAPSPRRPARCARAPPVLLDGDRLGEVARLIDVQAAPASRSRRRAAAAGSRRASAAASSRARAG